MSKEKLPKAKDMIEDNDVVKYDGELSELIETYNQEIKKVKDDTELSNLAFFDMGKKLIEVEKKIKDDNAESQKAKKIFAAFKFRVSKQINKNISNVDKVFKVAQFCETETYKKYENRLPSGWGTLYLLLSLKDDKKEIDVSKIDDLMLDADITKGIRRADLIRKIEKIKEPNKVIKQKITITIEDGIELTQEKLKEFQVFVHKKFSKKWNVTSPEIKPEVEDKKDNTDTDSKSDSETSQAS